MGYNTPHALGREKFAYAKLEAVAHTYEPLVGNDAFRVLSFDITPNITRQPVEEGKASRSVIEHTTEKGTVTWAIKALIRPSGASGTPPDLSPLLEAAFGVHTGGGTDVYSLDTSQVLSTLTMMRAHPNALQEVMTGCIVDRWSLEMQGGSRPVISFEGRASSYVAGTRSTLDAAMVSSTSMSIQSGDANHFGVNNLVSIGGDDRSGGGYLIATDSGGGDFVLSSAASASEDDEVIVFSPSPSVAGSPLSGIVGSLAMAGVARPIVGFSLSHDNQNEAFEDEAFEQFYSDATPGERIVTGTVTLRARRDQIGDMLIRKLFGTQAILLTMGDTSGARAILSCAQAEYGYDAIESPEAGPGMLKIPFVAKAQTAGEDEVVLSFT